MIDEKTYCAAVCNDASCLPGEFCDVSVWPTQVAMEDDNGRVEYEPEPGPDGAAFHLVFCAETNVRQDQPDQHDVLLPAADEILAEQGFERVEPWGWADTAAYAAVRRVA